MDKLYAVRARDIWDYLKNESAPFWLVNVYLFLEYVRPQAIYPVMDVLPYGKIVLVLTLIVLILKKEGPFLKHAGNKLLLLFFLVILVSSVLALSPALAFGKVPDFLAWMIIYFLIINIVNTEKRFFVFMLAFLLYSFKMSQFSLKNWIMQGFAFSDWGTGGGPGWFHNSGEFGIQMCIFLPISAYFYVSLKEHWPRWKKGLFLLFPVSALSGTISCSSRGALIGAGVVLVLMTLRSRHKGKGIVVMALAAALVFTLLPKEQLERFRQAGEDRTSITRMERWNRGLKMAERFPYFGVGYANWSIAERSMFGVSGGLSHNVFIECLSELGYAGLSAFVLLILFTFACNRRTRKLASKAPGGNRFLWYMAYGLDAALVGYLVSGFFVTVLYYPYFWINLAMTVALNGVAGKSSLEPDAVGAAA